MFKYSFITKNIKSATNESCTSGLSMHLHVELYSTIQGVHNKLTNPWFIINSGGLFLEICLTELSETQFKMNFVLLNSIE